MNEFTKPAILRRKFLKGAATGAAALLAKPSLSSAQGILSAEAAPPAAVEVGAPGRPASDFMVDVFRSLGMEYMFAMCASKLYRHT